MFCIFVSYVHVLDIIDTYELNFMGCYIIDVGNHVYGSHSSFAVIEDTLCDVSDTIWI